MPYKDPVIAKQKAKERYLKNHEERKRKNKADYYKNREVRLEKVKNYAKENSAKIGEYQKKWRGENKEKIQQYKKEHYAENKEEILEKQSEYQRNNMDKHKIRMQKYYSTERGKLVKMAYRNSRRSREKHAILDGSYKDKVLEIYKSCQEMRKRGLDVEVDHIIPVAHKDICGLHVPWNLQIIPRIQNRKKTNKLIPCDLDLL